MNDLIRKSDVNDVIDELEIYTCGRPNTMKVEISVLQLQRLINKLKNIPTAYDPDKVVEEFERIRAKKTCNKEKCDTKEICRICVVDDAIEIVKQGGVFDDVCEWKYTKEIMDNAEFKVGCNQNALKRGIVPNNFSYHDFKYCPYCGKKIKVVE